MVDFSQVSRRLELDYAKGFASLLLILSHCMVGTNALKTWIFSFHMPIFFIICGVLQANKYPNGISVTEIIIHLKKRFKQLLVPYFIFGMVLIIFYQLLHVVGGEVLSLDTQLIRLITLQGIESMWFIPVYLIAELIFITIVLRLSAALRDTLALGVVGVLWCIQMIGFPNNNLLRLMIKVLIALVYIYLGYLTERFELFNKISVVIALCCVVICGGGALWNGFVGIGSLQIQNIALFFANGTMTSVSIIIILKWMAENLKSPIILLDYLGRNTIVVLCTNNLLIEIVRLLDYKLTGNFLLNSGMMGELLFAIIVTVVELLFIKSSEGWMAPFFGKIRKS